MFPQTNSQCSPNIYCLCIPRVTIDIDEKKIRSVFNDLALGDIKKIDIISKKTEKNELFNRVFIHFHKWFTNLNATNAHDRLINGKEIKIVYDVPWFWKVSAYRPPSVNHKKHKNL